MSDRGTPTMTPYDVPGPRKSGRLLRLGGALLAAGLVASVLGGALDGERARTAYGYLWGFSFFWTLCLGALLLIALHHLTSAVWSVVFRRVMEMLASPLWMTSFLFIPILLVALFGEQIAMFPWLLDSARADHVLHGKAPFLNLKLFLVRAAVYFTVWTGFSLFFVRGSLGQDSGRLGERTTLAMRRLAAPFVILFGVTTTFAGIDWLMSLEPLWFSTMFGVYVFAGMMVSALAAVTIASLTLLEHGRMGEGIVKDDHVYNLGTLMFAFTVFWGYIAFSQYMLIWYANMPEETFYIQKRLEGSWLPVSMSLAVVRFALPFLLLLSRGAKTRRSRLLGVAAIILVGQLLDLYWLIMPQAHADAPALGWQELGPLALFLGILLLAVASFLKKHKPVPVGDPLLKESVCFKL